MSIKDIKSKISHGAARAPWLTITLSFLMLGLYFMGNQVFEFFILDKTAVINGEGWRIITGHFVHCSIEHLSWDVLAFLIIGSILELNNPKHLLPSILISCCFVSLWLFLGEPELKSYCGFSGALNGLLVIVTILLWSKLKEKVYLWVLIATICKIIYECTNHTTTFTNLPLQAVPTSHAAGFIGGCLYLLIFKLLRKLNYFLMDNIKNSMI